MSKTKAAAAVGGLSRTSKMPAKSYGLPAAECATGSKLHKVAGSVCADCYALKGNYRRYPAIVAAQYRRLATISGSNWVADMVTAIGSDAYFRWHDSGDIQSREHLAKICAVAEATPDCQHWLPTREKRIVRDYARAGGSIPANLVIRISAAMVDGEPPRDFPHTSTVHKHAEPLGHRCPAPDQDGKCGDCRACWNSSVKNVSYCWH